MGLYGDCRVPANLTFKLELMWRKVFNVIDVIFDLFVANGPVELNQGVRHVFLFFNGNRNIEAERCMFAFDSNTSQGIVDRCGRLEEAGIIGIE